MTSIPVVPMVVDVALAVCAEQVETIRAEFRATAAATDPGRETPLALAAGVALDRLAEQIAVLVNAVRSMERSAR